MIGQPRSESGRAVPTRGVESVGGEPSEGIGGEPSDGICVLAICARPAGTLAGRLETRSIVVGDENARLGRRGVGSALVSDRRMVFVRISGGGPARSGKLKTRCGGMRRALRGELRGGFLTALGDPGRSPSNTASTCSCRFEGRASGGMCSIREGGKRGPLGARIVPPVLLASELCGGVAGNECGAEDR